MMAQGSFHSEMKWLLFEQYFTYLYNLCCRRADSSRLVPTSRNAKVVKSKSQVALHCSSCAVGPKTPEKSKSPRPHKTKVEAPGILTQTLKPVLLKAA